jgi:hypothetical protein
MKRRRDAAVGMFCAGHAFLAPKPMIRDLCWP